MTSGSPFIVAGLDSAAICGFPVASQGVLTEAVTPFARAGSRACQWTSRHPAPACEHDLIRMIDRPAKGRDVGPTANLPTAGLEWRDICFVWRMPFVDEPTARMRIVPYETCSKDGPSRRWLQTESLPQARKPRSALGDLPATFARRLEGAD
jgi:hypothetical protein